MLDGYAELAQTRWAAWRRRSRIEARAPERFADVLDAVIAFADPLLGQELTTHTWSDGAREWI